MVVIGVVEGGRILVSRTNVEVLSERESCRSGY